VRLWVRQADIDDGHQPGVTTAKTARVRELEQEVRELRRANEIQRRGRVLAPDTHVAFEEHRTRWRVARLQAGGNRHTVPARLCSGRPA